MTTQTKADERAQLQYLNDERAIIWALYEYAHSFDYGPRSGSETASRQPARRRSAGAASSKASTAITNR